jgi:hypothetical protein
MRFSYRMVPEVYQLFWAAMARGEFITDAAVEAGTYRRQGTRWLVAAGGVRSRRGRGLKGRCLRLAPQDGKAGHEPGAAWQGGGRPGQEVLPGTDRGPVVGRLL